MATGYVLVLAVLILGGVIATLGDRIGMRVGKARLSLFRLRPRQTATLVSILTGSVISASTLALLFGVSRQLRTGVFELEQIQADLSQAEAELANARQEKAGIEEALTDSRQEQQEAEEDLREINQFLQEAVEQQQTTQSELQRSQGQLETLRSQLSDVSQQSAQLQQEIQRLDSERSSLLSQQEAVQGEIEERDRAIAQRDDEIVQRDRDIAKREQRLSELQSQQAMLQEDVIALERQYEGLFRGSVAVGRNQALVSALIRVRDRSEARRAVDQLLREANQSAIQQIAPGISRDQQVLLIAQEDVSRLIDRINNGQPYVVRVMSAANYIIGEPCVVANAEPCVQVFVDATVNEVIYQQNERLAAVTVDPRSLTNQDLVEKLNLLVNSLQFRARQDGIVSESLQIANGRTEALLAFLGEIKTFNEPIEIQAIASRPILTIGPLQVELFAVSDGEILLRTDELPRETPEDEEPMNSPTEVR
ncbi:DUF3084 domain-containing protein [Oscillatoria sp. CS-180]|uniref:DUF3084 domain-containing protein n=1 Tax=Oscillatoria sp. CS-180 TaxID=3021720 RepID=UPI00232CE664|nr:DUF3084 domain-containing protein [Oscillatoria sp. CS-180]MDB9527952.1 DUF3084 domain-containing protein [Oscillatoria sp. CS-180]